jgi:hypothetical protein
MVAGSAARGGVGWIEESSEEVRGGSRLGVLAANLATWPLPSDQRCSGGLRRHRLNFPRSIPTLLQ